MNRNRVLIGLLFLCVASVLYAETESAENLSIHGFSMLLLTKEGSAEKAKASHTWLAVKTTMGRVELFAHVAPLGPAKLLHNAQATWRAPRVNLTAGRFIPPFGWEYPNYRIDRIPLVFYGSVGSRFMVARDVGVQAQWKSQWLEATGAVFAGQRMGGNVPVTDRGEPDAYLRARLRPIQGVRASVSKRLSSVPAHGFDTVLEYGKAHIASEVVVSNDEWGYYVLGKYALHPRAVPAVRFERMPTGDTWTFGISTSPVDDHGLKLNYLLKDGPDALVGELIFRW